MESERTALEGLTAIIQTRDPDVIEGHNLFKFDLPFLTGARKETQSSARLGTRGLDARLPPVTPADRGKRRSNIRNSPQRGRHIVDTWVLAQYYDVSSRELESFGLKNVARHFGVSEKNRVFLEGTDIHARLPRGPGRLSHICSCRTFAKHARWRQS